MKKLLFLGFSLIVGIYSSQNNSPRTCGTQAPPQQYETWVNGLINKLNNGPKNSSSSIQSIFTIPVIVHIIHNNEAVNSINATSGNNLNAAQVINQIAILNKDYNGLNSDTNLIPTVFKPLLGKFQVNFCLAVVNPTGGVLAEPGIDRINRVSKGWTNSPYTQTYIDGTIKPNSIWDVTRYLNIWVCNLGNSLLGYATFPNPGSSGLSGLSSPYGTTTSDGVVILNTAFGSIGTAGSGAYNLGRTSTHEIGHWMGLRHIWGDGTCATDYCNDTPPAQNSNFGCPNYPYKLGTCTGNTTGEMTMNYMDYTNDACMYMFTQDQKYRAQLILTNSALRSSVITSTACSLPTSGTDVGISSVARPTYSQVVNCNNFIDPILNVTNYGTSTITSMIVTYNVDGLNTQTFTWTGSVNPNATFTLAIPQITNLSAGAHTFSANLSSPNNSTDVNLGNNNNLQNFSITNPLNVVVNSASTCAGSSVTLAVSGANSYLWNTSVTTSVIVVSPTTTTIYSVTGSNASCNVTRSATVTIIAGPLMSISSATACSGATVNLNASGANSYSWSTGSNAASIVASNSTTTTYTVIGSGTTACNASQIATLTILPSPNLVANNMTICAGGSATLNVSGANSYSWSTGSTNNNIAVNPSTSTNYLVTGTVNTCTQTKTVSVTIGSALSLFLSPAQPSTCAGSAITINATGANNYVWSSGGTASSITLNPSATTVYTLSGTSINCPGTKVFTLTVVPLPLTSISATNASCFGSSNGQLSANSSGNAPFTYTYSPGNANLPAGIYSVTTQDNLGCVSITTVAITQPPVITANPNTGTTTCPTACNASVQINVSGGVPPYNSTTYPGAIVGTNLTSLCPGNYTALIGDGNGCSLSKTFTVAAGNIGIQVTTTVTNLSCSTCNDAVMTAAGLSGTAPYTYVWNPGNFTSDLVTDVAAGCYTVTVTDAKGCTGESVVCVSFDLGIRQLDGTQMFIVKPNPSSGIFIISGLADKASIMVYDVRGRLITEQTTKTGDSEINISELADGLYYARIIQKDQTAILRLLKQ